MQGYLKGYSHTSKKIFSATSVTFRASARLKEQMKTEEQHKIEHILAGKTEEFAYFLDTYGQQVFNLIVHMVDSEDDAEELTQDTFLKAFQHLSSFNGKSQFSTWIYRIAYNTALTALRKKHIEQTADEKLWNTISDTETDDILDDTSEERIERLRKALDRLPADERALITFFYEEEKSISEIAVITGQTEGNVKVKLSRLRKKLAIWMQEEN